MTFRELRDKQVVQLETGTCLGRIDDLIFDPETAKVQSFVMLGRPRLFGLLGRGESLSILREEVQNYGQDAILVTTPLPPQQPPTWHWPWEK
jgi:YlmC/YmxH family sporulation protein